MNGLPLLLFCCFVLSLPVAAQQPATEGFVTIDGSVTSPQKLSAPDIGKLKHITVPFQNKGGKEHLFSGVAVADLLAEAGATLGKQLHGKTIAQYVLVACADGYQVVFALVDFDSTFTNKQVLLANSMDGAVLPPGKDPFQLIVPDEKRPARSAYQVTGFVVRYAKN